MTQRTLSHLTVPRARDTELTVEHLPSETIVYDHQRHRVHCLNHTVDFIWKQCDGRTTIQQIAERLPEALSLPSDPDIVLVGLQKLNKIHLLNGELPNFTPNELPSRRELARRVGLVGVAAAVLPLVTSIVAPTPAMAGNTGKDDHKNGKKGK